MIPDIFLKKRKVPTNATSGFFVALNFYWLYWVEIASGLFLERNVNTLHPKEEAIEVSIVNAFRFLSLLLNPGIIIFNPGFLTERI